MELTRSEMVQLTYPWQILWRLVSLGYLHCNYSIITCMSGYHFFKHFLSTNEWAQSNLHWTKRRVNFFHTFRQSFNFWTEKMKMKIFEGWKCSRILNFWFPEKLFFNGHSSCFSKPQIWNNQLYIFSIKKKQFKWITHMRILLHWKQ